MQHQESRKARKQDKTRHYGRRNRAAIRERIAAREGRMAIRGAW